MDPRHAGKDRTSTRWVSNDPWCAAKVRSFLEILGSRQTHDLQQRIPHLETAAVSNDSDLQQRIPHLETTAVSNDSDLQ